MSRKQITEQELDNAIFNIRFKLFKRLEEKGYGAFVSRHEVLGVITEEYTELIEAVEGKSLDEVKSEIVDIVVGGIFALACIDSNTLDW